VDSTRSKPGDPVHARTTHTARTEGGHPFPMAQVDWTRIRSAGAEGQTSSSMGSSLTSKVVTSEGHEIPLRNLGVQAAACRGDEHRKQCRGGRHHDGCDRLRGASRDGACPGARAPDRSDCRILESGSAARATTGSAMASGRPCIWSEVRPGFPGNYLRPRWPTPSEPGCRLPRRRAPQAAPGKGSALIRENAEAQTSSSKGIESRRGLPGRSSAAIEATVGSLSRVARRVRPRAQPWRREERASGARYPVRPEFPAAASACGGPRPSGHRKAAGLPGPITA
jgi:hypothetical protein